MSFIYGKKYYAIYGFGVKGRQLFKILPYGSVIFFIDSDSNKQGLWKVNDIPIISFENMEAELQNSKVEIEIILTFKDEKLENKLKDHKISYIYLLDFLKRKDFVEYRLECIYDKFMNDNLDLASCFYQKNIDKFRNTYEDEFNEKLVNLMIEDKDDEVSKILDNFYKNLSKIRDKNGMHYDEYYENRYGMKLIRKQLQNKKELQVVDIACGHGELLSKIKEDGHTVLGVEIAKDRVDYCNSRGVKCIMKEASDTGIPSESFDVVIATELLEHLKEPKKVLTEIRRILKKGGEVMCTVPLGRYCASNTHVRFFSRESLYSLFKSQGYEVENLCTLPYITSSLLDDNIIIKAVKNSEFK